MKPRTDRGGPSFVLLLVAAGGAGAAGLGTFLRWATVRAPLGISVDIGGFDEGRRGGMVLLLAAVCAVLALAGAFSNVRGISSAAVAIAGGLLLLVALREADKLRDDGALARLLGFGLIQTSRGPGIVFVVLGAFVAVGAGLAAAVIELMRSSRGRVV